MLKSKLLHAALALALIGFIGCKSSDSRQSQGAASPGQGGEMANTVSSSDNRLVGAVLGGALGEGGGYVVGANTDLILARDHEAATRATQNARTHPATAQDVRNSNTADLNHDGFVTMDEISAMRTAGLSDSQMLQRLRATDQIFELTAEQEQFLRNHEVDSYFILQMENINRDKREQILKSGNNPAGMAPSSGTTNYPSPKIYPNT